MTRTYCTLLDSTYLLRGIALYTSLARHALDAQLTVFCFDERAAEILDQLRLRRMSVVTLDQLKEYRPELRTVEGNRTRPEFCWTATPLLPLYMLDTSPQLSDVTYLDADLMFFSDPQPIFKEMGDASVLITPHRYAPPYLHHQVAGIYNVQFMTFRNDARGRQCLEWWRDRCQEWCFARLEDGKYGDQKYLDDWPTRFSGVHALAHKGAGAAPWNLCAYEIKTSEKGVLIDRDPLIFFHYHGLRLLANGRHRLAPPGYLVSRRVREVIYRPYLDVLGDAVHVVRKQVPGFPLSLDPVPERAQRLREARIEVTERIIQRVGPLMKLRTRIAQI
jgi:hypothetical protein